MKAFFSILIFIAFAVRPVIELSTVAYYQLNIDSIIDKYCINKERPKLRCNGKCYLMSQMKKNTSASKDAKNVIITEAFIPLFFQNTSLEINFNTSYYQSLDNNWSIQHIYFKDIVKSIDHPPEIFTTHS